MEDDKQINQEKTDRFTSLMFGSGRGQPKQTNQPEEPLQQQSTIDYEELMGNIDSLMESLKGIKPLFQKVYPFIEQIWKKK